MSDPRTGERGDAVTIRRSRPADATPLLHLAALDDAQPLDVDALDGNVLVAEVDGVVAGYGYASSFRPRPGYRFTVEDSVYLRPEFGGRGLGRLLLGELIRASKAAGCHQMIGVIGGENPASIAMHRAMGFVDVGVLRNVGFKFGNWVDVTFIQREL